MAKLTSGPLTFEFRFKKYDDQRWIQYEILFLLFDQPMIPNNLLKRYNEYWSDRSPGAFKANEYEHDSLIQTLRNILDTDKPGYWIPMEPDIIIRFFPNASLPMLPEGFELVSISDETLQEFHDNELIREVAGGRLPTDPFIMVAMIDVYNFEKVNVYMGEGPALVMTPTRHELRQFLTDLEREYADFCQQWGVPAVGDNPGS